jgi:hypothetical protein
MGLVLGLVGKVNDLKCFVEAQRHSEASSCSLFSSLLAFIIVALFTIGRIGFAIGLVALFTIGRIPFA